MCDPRQGSTLARQPRKTTCRGACAVGSTYSTGGSATCLYQLRTHTPTPSPTLALAQTHAHTHARTHTHTAQAGRRTWGARHIFPPRNGLFIKWNKAERAQLAPGTSTPPSRSCPPPLRGQSRSIAPRPSWLIARSPSLARSFHRTWPDGPVAHR